MPKAPTTDMREIRVSVARVRGERHLFFRTPKKGWGWLVRWLRKHSGAFSTMEGTGIALSPTRVRRARRAK